MLNKKERYLHTIRFEISSNGVHVLVFITSRYMRMLVYAGGVYTCNTSQVEKGKTKNESISSTRMNFHFKE